MTREQDDAVLAQAKVIEAKRSEEYRLQARAVEARINGQGEPFKDEELVYAASSRCKCGAGFAYPSTIGMHGSWHCSHLLKTREPRAGHSDSMPFAFWSVRSESQIARNNGIVTTRPEGAPWGSDMEMSVKRENERRSEYEPHKPLVDLATAPIVRPMATPTT